MGRGEPHVMLGDEVIEFLEAFGTVLVADWEDGKGPIKTYIVNGIGYQTTEEENKFLIKKLPTN